MANVGVSGPGSSPALDLIRAEGRRYVGLIRIVTLVPVTVVAVLAADTTWMRVLVLLALGGVSVWSVFYRRGLAAGDVVLVTLADTAVLVALAAATPLLVPDSWLVGGHSWVRPFTTFAAVGYQYTVPARLAVPVGALLCLTVGVLTNRATPGAPGLDGIITAGWSVVTMLLAQLLWTLLARAGRRADAALETADSAERQRLLDEGVLADEKAVNASLHDTVLGTLDGLSMGQTDDLDQVRQLARRSLATLRELENYRPGPVSADLGLQVLTAVDLAEVTVEYEGPQGPLEVPSAVARAFTGAVSEALWNVRRHAGVLEARVQFTAKEGDLRIEIHDAGKGFDPQVELQGVPGGHRGLRYSIHQRMLSVGGSAQVTSRAGAGTQIILAWSDD